MADKPTVTSQTLGTPEGTASIRLKFEFEPATSGCVVFGRNVDGGVERIEVSGSGEHDLPFSSPEIRLQWYPDLEWVMTTEVRHFPPGAPSRR